MARIEFSFRIRLCVIREFVFEDGLITCFLPLYFPYACTFFVSIGGSKPTMFGGVKYQVPRIKFALNFVWADNILLAHYFYINNYNLEGLHVFCPVYSSKTTGISSKCGGLQHNILYTSIYNRMGSKYI